jgi:tRNA(adenine34) deaminase
MELALEEAKRAADKFNEVPIGAVVVRRDEDAFRVLATASNRVETNHDASAHAELLALRQAAQRNKNWRLVNATLYTTLEPCPLCLSASLNFRVGRLVYGAPDHRLGAVETVPNALMETHPFHTIKDVKAGLLQNQSAALLQAFFRRKRAGKKLSKLRTP